MENIIMKFTPIHYELMYQSIKDVLDSFTTEELQHDIRLTQSNSSLKDYRITFMWRVFFYTRKVDKDLAGMIDGNSLSRRNGMKYNDSHIETALKKIFKDYGLLYP